MPRQKFSAVVDGNANAQNAFVVFFVSVNAVNKFDMHANVCYNGDRMLHTRGIS